MASRVGSQVLSLGRATGGLVGDFERGWGRCPGQIGALPLPRAAAVSTGLRAHERPRRAVPGHLGFELGARLTQSVLGTVTVEGVGYRIRGRVRVRVRVRGRLTEGVLGTVTAEGVGYRIRVRVRVRVRVRGRLTEGVLGTVTVEGVARLGEAVKLWW